MYILDTDIVINYLRGEKEAKKIVETLTSNWKNYVFITSVTSFEMTKGCFLSENWEKNFDTFKTFKNQIYHLDFDENSGYVAGELFADLQKKGKMININDIYIASICLYRNFTLVTNNKKHFQGIKGLRIYSK